LSLFLITKIGVTVGIVLALSLAAERVSPRVAGVLAGYPLGAAIALFFIGLEISPDFAARSAVYTLAGLAASQVFVYCYFMVSSRIRSRSIPVSSAAALAGYFAAAWLLHPISFSRAGAALTAAASMLLSAFLFRRVPNVAIARSVRFTPAVLLLRACLAAGIIVAITAAAGAVGPAWAGLFSAFPTALFPLLLIVHITYDKAHVHTIIKNFPPGLGSLIAYGLSVSYFYPAWGVGWGTPAAFGIATLYLLAYSAVVARRLRLRRS
jgi:uncharacterized membrane protein (GlpM family)